MLKRFGTHKRVLRNVNQHASKKYSFLLEQWQNQILAISESDPVIERYNFNGELINSLKLSKLDFLQSRIKHSTNEQRKKSRKKEMVGITGFFPYSCLQGDKLYLLVYGLDESRNKPTSHHILVLEVTQKDLRPIKIFNLIKDKGKNPWYYSFSIVDKKLIAFDAYTYEIHEYRLPF